MLSKEVKISYPELTHLANGVLNTFFQRRDLYARQLDDGRYVCIQRPLTINHILAHLRGDLTLGTYILDQRSQARFVIFDADDDAQFLSLTAMYNNLASEDIPAYLEASRRGGHLWLFLPYALPGKIARKFSAGLAKKFDLCGMEIFPKQDCLKDGPGSLIRLPFGIHRRTGQRYGFLSPMLGSLPLSLSDQVQWLCSPKVIPEPVIDLYCSIETNPILHKTAPKTIAGEGPTLSARIKNSISVYDFVGQYVQLTANGRGLCPFHEDRVHSFAVNATENYWHCFAGCGGGSIIDFWMKMQKCDFTTAVRELAHLLLSSSNS